MKSADDKPKRWRRQDAVRQGKRLPIWLSPYEAAAIDKACKRLGLPSRIAFVRHMLTLAKDAGPVRGE